MPTVFALSSWGNSGVPWIHSCLKLHPKIQAWCCLNYGAYSPLGRALTPAEYVDSLARIGWQDAPVVGDLCGVSWTDFDALTETFGEMFRGGILVGHPVQRLAGSFNFSHEVNRTWSHADFLSMWGMTPDDPRAVAAYSALGDEGDHIPASYMAHVITINQVWGPGGALNAPVYRLEDLLTSDEAWTGMVNHLSGGEIPDYGPMWRQLEGVCPNSAHAPFQSSPREVWDAFPEYVRRTMAAMMTEEARETFEILGYDVSFVR